MLNMIFHTVPVAQFGQLGHGVGQVGHIISYIVVMVGNRSFGQLKRLQFDISSYEPTQLPPFFAIIVLLRVLTLSPNPQVFEHSLHSAQCPHVHGSRHGIILQTSSSLEGPEHVLSLFPFMIIKTPSYFNSLRVNT